MDKNGTTTVPDEPETPTESKPGNRRGRKLGSKNRRTIMGGEYLRSLAPRAKRRLAKLIEGNDDVLAFRAAVAVLEYTFGKPVETKHIGGDGGEPLTVQRLEEMPPFEAARRLTFVKTVLERAAGIESVDAPSLSARTRRTPTERLNGAPAPPSGQDRAKNGKASLAIGEILALGPGARAVVTDVDRDDLPTWRAERHDGDGWAEVKILRGIKSDGLALWYGAAAGEGLFDD